MSDKPDANGRYNERFHIDKSVSIGHIITTVTLIVALIGGLITTDRRIENNVSEIEKNSLRIAAAERSAERERELIVIHLQRIEDKLDRNIEKASQ